jgi:glutathione S-transferase
MRILERELDLLSYVIPVYQEITGMKMVTFPSLFAWMANFLSSPVVKDHLPPLDHLMHRYQAIREAFLKNTSCTYVLDKLSH